MCALAAVALVASSSVAGVDSTRARTSAQGAGDAAPAVQEPVPDPAPPVPAPDGPPPGGEEAPDARAEVQEPPPEEPLASASAPLTSIVYEPRYHDLAQTRALLVRWAGATRAVCDVDPLVVEAGGTRVELPRIAFGALGDVPLAERPTVFLLGGLDGVSLAGTEAVLATTAELLAGELRPDLAFVALPWAAPRALESAAPGGRSPTPIDEDRDEQSDEDGPDDVDGDGRLLDMLIEDPRGPWTFAGDRRFLAPARAGDSPRFRLAREGKDDDGDGRYNEDPIGGTNLDRNFPVGWVGPEFDPLAGPYPLSEPVARALADFVLTRNAVAVLVFQGNHGLLATPGASPDGPWPPNADARDFDLATRLFARATGRAQPRSATLAEAKGRIEHGAALDWLYAVPGALALEVGVWGPDVESPPPPRDVALSDALFGEGERGANGTHSASLEDQAWARWLDNTRGGIGFVDWHPVELGEGRSALVGGWEPFSRRNPPVESLSRALQGIPGFVRVLVDGLPRLEVRVLEARRDGDLCRIRVRVANTGLVTTGLWTTGRGALDAELARGASIELELPPEARLIAGEALVDLGRLAGESTSRELAWVVLAEPGSVLGITARSCWTIPVRREVKP